MNHAPLDAALQAYSDLALFPYGCFTMRHFPGLDLSDFEKERNESPLARALAVPASADSQEE